MVGSQPLKRELYLAERGAKHHRRLNHRRLLGHCAVRSIEEVALTAKAYASYPGILSLQFSSSLWHMKLLAFFELIAQLNLTVV